MSRNILIEISVLNPTTQLITTLHMSASNATAEGVYLDNKTWVPAIINDPEQSFGYWGDGRAQSLSVSYGQINFIVSTQLGNKAWTKLDFDGGDATVWDGELGADFASYTQIYTGKIGPLVSDSSREAHFSLLGMEAQLDRELLDRTFAGTGGDEGPSSMLGILKPISFGDCQNVAPVKLDPIRFIYAVDGYKAVTVNTVYSSALTLDAPVATVANYAALAALTLKPGEWARCPSYFRLGGDPTNAKITADIGTPATTSAVARALVRKAGILPARIGVGFSTGTRGYSLYLTDQANIGDAVRDAAFAESRLLLTDSKGVLHLAPMASAKAPVTLSDDGSSRPFVRCDTIVGEAPASPAWQVRIGHTPVWTVNSGAGEISEAVAKQAEDATATRKAADDARAEADKANAAIDIIEKRLDATVADGVLDRAEKRQWIASYEAATAERDALVDEGTDQGATAQVATYIAAYDALTAYLDGLVPAFADTSKDTPIDGATFKARFVGYAVAKQALLNSIADKASKTSTWTGVTGPAKPADYADVTGDNTSKNTNAVGDVPAVTVNKNITDARKIADDARKDIDSINAEALPIMREAQRVSGEAIDAARGDIDQIKLDYDEVVENVQSITATGGPIDNVRAEASRIDKAYIAGDKALGERVDIISASSTSGGGNLLSNTDFTTLTGWNVAGNPAGASISRNAAGETWMAGGENNLLFFQDGRSSGGDSDYIEAVSEPFTVTPSSWIQFYVYGASHRANNWVSLFYYRANGEYAGYAGENMAPRWDHGGRDPNGWDQIGRRSDKVPSDAVCARMVLRKYNTFAGQGNSYAWFWRPYVSIAREGQTSWNPYASGNNKAVEVATNASIKTTSNALATSDKAFAEFKRDINATLDTPETGIKAKLSLVETAISDKRFAASTRVDALEATINTPATGLSAKVASHESAIVSLPDNYATASRANSLEASVANTGSSIAKNDKFAYWPDGQAMPSNWSTWQANGNYRVERHGGRGGSPYCVRTMNDMAEVESGFVQSPYLTGPGKYVIEVSAESDGSGFRGSGVTLSGIGGLDIDFCRDADTNGVVGDAVNSRRSWTKMVDIGAYDTLNLHAMHGWLSWGRGVAAKYMFWHYLSLRPASAGEILAGKVDNDLNKPGGLSAKVTSHDTVITNLPTNYAKASRADALEASVDGPTGALAKITALQTVTSNGTFAAASTVSTLRSEYDDTASTVTTQAGTIKGLQDKNKAYWQVVADAGGGVASLTVAADGYGAGVNITGNVTIDGGLMVNGSITSSKMGASSVQQVAYQTLTYDVAVPRGGSYPGGSGGGYDPGTGGGGGGGGYNPNMPNEA